MQETGSNPIPSIVVMYSNIEFLKLNYSWTLLMLASTSNANPKLTEYIPKEIEEKMCLLIVESLPYYKSIFKEMILANYHNALLLYEFLVTEQWKSLASSFCCYLINNHYCQHDLGLRNFA